MTLLAHLRRDRNIPGDLVALDDDGNVIHRCPVLCKADNGKAAEMGNPSRNPLLPFGDTPTGVYRLVKAGPWQPASTYGTHPVLLMIPISGDALESHRGPRPRKGLAVHEGAAGSNPATAFLRPTFGCPRVASDDMRQIWLLAATFGEPDTLEVVEAA